MLRLLGYFALVFVVMQILRHVPGIGGLFSIPFVGFILASLVISAVVSWGTARLVDARKQRGLMWQLGAVDTPHNQGKLGSLILAQGRPRRAIPHLERAHEGEPESGEWPYRLGCALLRARRANEAAPVLERAAAIDETRAYGAVLLRLAEAQQASGKSKESLHALERYERNHGSSPESACRRGVALRALGRRDEARAAFAEVSKLAAQAARFQRKSAHAWTLRAWLARIV